MTFPRTPGVALAVLLAFTGGRFPGGVGPT
jgi:hypothetical protein